MSLQPVWMSRDAGCLADGDVGYDSSSRIESKRGQWFMDANGPQMVNKKQAIETINGRPVSGVPHMNFPWENTPGFQSVPVHCNDRLFGSEPIRAGSLVDNRSNNSIQSIGSGNMNMGRKGFENQFGSTSSTGLSMSHTIEDPSACLNFGGIRKVKVNQVRDTDNIFAGSMGNSYGRVDHRSDISLGQTYHNGEENTISIASSYPKSDESFVSVGNGFNKGNGNFISMGNNYSNGNNNNLLSMGKPYDKSDHNFISAGRSYEKDVNVMALASSYNKGPEDFISIGASYGKPNDSFIQMAPSFFKGNENIMPAYKAESSFIPADISYNRADSGNLSVGQNYKGDSSTISFGGFHEESESNNSSGGIISGYDLLEGNQKSCQTLEVFGKKLSIMGNVDSVVNSESRADSTVDDALKNKETKLVRKAFPNNFPSNVKSLLSTGMFDGVPVKYVSWSRDKNLKGIIKGTGYLCSCAKCNHSKALNAFEYERHAGCKTKHPNNHIYFDNGKTIYAVVQELKNTPQEALFDLVLNVTGSPIHQKNYRIWKASYQAATRELQRIYGKDEVALS